MASPGAQDRASAEVGSPGEGARRRRVLRIAGGLLAALVAAYGLAQAAARRACAGGALRQRIAATLAAHVGPVELGPDVQVDPLFRVRFGPLRLPGARPADAPLVTIDSVRVRPDLAGLLRTGRVTPARVRLDGVRISLPDRPGAWAELAARLGPRPRGAAPAAATPPAPLPAVRVRDLAVEFTFGGRRATLGPLQATVRALPAADGSRNVSATLDLPGEGQAVVDLRREGPSWRADARIEGLDPRALPAGLDGLAAAWTGGALTTHLDATLTPARREARVHVDAAGRGLTVGGPVVGEPLGPVDLGFTGELTWDGRRRRLRLDRGRLALPGGAPVTLEAELGTAAGLPLTVHARAEALDYLATVAALPPALALPEDAPHPAGTLDAHLDVSGPLADPGAWQVDAGIDLSRMRKEARRAPPVALAGTFVQRAEVEGRPPHEFLVGPGSPDFVPLGELPPYVIRAVTTCEDAGFFGHSGFDFEELRNAAVQGAQAGRVVRGGSTISQQLAKNLYLTREKTLARKLREAVLTVALESTLSKQRLLEIYLNVAEWGPGVWGIGPAARHWFGKDARELTPKEAAFLATVIPNPVRYHYMWSRGWLSEHWEERVEGLLRVMAVQGLLSDEELARAQAQPLTFARCAAGAAPATGVTCRGT